MVKASGEEVGRGLEGNWRDDLLFELRQTGATNRPWILANGQYEWFSGY